MNTQEANIAAEAAKASVRSIREMVNAAFVHYANEHATPEGVAETSEFYANIVGILHDLEEVPLELVKAQFGATPQAAPEAPKAPEQNSVQVTPEQMRELLRTVLPKDAFAAVSKMLPKA